MRKNLLAIVTGSILVGATLVATPAEARRLFWWQADNQPVFDFYGDYPDQQASVVQDQFNQDEYDLYQEEMRRRKRQRYSSDYFDPQVDQPSYDVPLRNQVKKKKKIARQARVSKPVTVTKQTVLVSKPAVVEQQAETPKIVQPQTASIGKRYAEPTVSKSVDCSKGAIIVSGFGFDGVTTKNCSSGALVYNATRSGKNFEVEVNPGNGELTSVKKL